VNDFGGRISEELKALVGLTGTPFRGHLGISQRDRMKINALKG